MWVDHDLGGCKIYERLALIFQNNLRCIIKIPDNFDVPFNALQKQIKDKICLFFNNSD